MRYDVVGIVLVAAFVAMVVYLLVQRGSQRRPPA